VAALVGGLELVVGVDLLGGPELEFLRHSMLRHHRVAVVIDDELGVDELTVILQQPVDPIAAAALLVRGQSEK
jgi:hypothetical protein